MPASTATYMAAATPAVTYSCINMTYEEARQILTSGQPLAVMMCVNYDYPYVAYANTVVLDTNCIGIADKSIELFWTPDEMTTTQPM